LWTWQKGLLLFGGGLLAAVLVWGISTVGPWVMIRAGMTNVEVIVAWGWVARFLGLHPWPYMPWRTEYIPSMSPDHWLCSAAILAHFASTYVLHPLQHFFLPAIAGLSIAKEQEQKRLASLRMTPISAGEFLVGKWLGVLTPFAIFWLVLVPGPLVWLAFEWAPPAYLGLHMASSLLSMATVALFGLCASACCRRATTALVVAYLLAWGVPMLAEIIPGWLCSRMWTVESRMWMADWRSENFADSYAHMLVLIQSQRIIVSLLVLVPTFLVARHFLQRRWRQG